MGMPAPAKHSETQTALDHTQSSGTSNPSLKSAAVNEVAQELQTVKIKLLNEGCE